MKAGFFIRASNFSDCTSPVWEGDNVRFSTWDAAHRYFAQVVTTREANIQEENYEPGENALKTYLVEVDGVARGNYEQKVQFLKAVSPRIFKRADVEQSDNNSHIILLRAEPQVHRRPRTPEEVLELEEHTTQPRLGAEHAELYIDCSNDRFWRIFTDSRADVSDRVIEQLTSKTSYLDRAWMPQQFLREVPAGSILRGTRLDFNNFLLSGQTEELDPRSIERIDMERLEQSSALDFKLEFKFKTNNHRLVNRAIDELLQSQFYSRYLSLTHLMIKRFSNPDVNAYIKSRIFYYGKLTSWGTDYDAHLDLMDHFYGRYAEKVLRFEGEYGINFSTENRMTTVSGAPIHIELGNDLEDLDAFVDTLMDPTGPFRLSGVAEHLSSQFIRVRAVDLYVKRPIDFEVTPNLLTIYLQPGSCGNTVMRLYTNIQRYFNAAAKLYGGDGHELL